MRSAVALCAIATATLLAIAVSSPASAGIIFSVPPPSTTIDLFAEYDEEVGTSVGPEAGSPAFFSDQATALGATGAPGQLKSFSQAGGAGGVSPVGATSSVNQVTNWAGSGVPSGTLLDLDLTIQLDGFLRIGDFANPGPGAIVASVALALDVITETGGTQSVFSGLGELLNDLPFNAESGWTASDFSCTGGSDETCTLDFSVVLEDAIFVDAGEVFAIQAQLDTVADVPGAFETIALADFFNTGTITLGTSTPGASFNPVPEPGAGALLGLGITALAAARRRRHA